MVMDIKDIMNTIPHRSPFLLVDRIEEMEEGKRIVGKKCVTYNEPFFAGHFPQEPVMPGVLIIEALAQTGAGISNSLAENGESGGSAGLIVAIILLAGGIVSIATRNGSKGGNIALIVLFALGALCGFTMAGSYADLNVWAAWCLICAVFAAVSLKKGQ